ncbi:cytochrome P450 [Nocardia wallacei]|uniref:Cytochrome P450 n=1 Tax=Nocardia wallacei TaxID=480035 RepID=A0A7G1KL10_9NOCA|nr:cytochrome P450 [Nocardia wallacei]BCK55925.1 cytochrome P450 [Nocardia wallacei]
MTEPAADVRSFPMPREARCPFDPPPELRRAPPVSRVRIWDGSEPWLVTGYRAVRALLADPRVSADATRPGYPFSTVALAASVKRGNTFMSMDDPEHAGYRRMLTSYFSIKRIESLRPGIQRMADDLIDSMLRGGDSADLVSAYALPLPSMVICELLGVPYDERERFQRLAGTSISTTSTAEQALAAADEMLGLIGAVVSAKRARPGPDILSHLVAQGELSDRQIAGIGRVLLLAGHETTANMIALGVAALLANPPQLRRFRAADDPVATAGAVEEILRYLTIVHHGRRRVARDDIEVDGTLIRAGEGLILAIESANRDPSVFEGDPDVLDLTRPARHHLAFAFGPHQCLAQALARVELQIAYHTVFRRIPGLRLDADIVELPYKHDMRIYGLHALPVRW